MTHKQVFLFLFTIYLIPICITAQSDSLISRCRSALRMDMAARSPRDFVIALIHEIEKKETLYLKSALYPDVRRYYEKLQVKLGDHYFKGKDFEKALRCFIEADKYSERGYSEKITVCKKAIKKKYFYPSNPKDILEFLDMMSDFIKGRGRIYSRYHKVCRRLLTKRLNGPQFEDITRKYEKYFPPEYDALMNHFFHVIYVRKARWQEKAKVIIEAGDWEGCIEKKMREILEEIKRIN